MQMEASGLEVHQYFCHLHCVPNQTTSGMNPLEAEIPIAFTAHETAESLLAAHQGRTHGPSHSDLQVVTFLYNEG